MKHRDDRKGQWRVAENGLSFIRVCVYVCVILLSLASSMRKNSISCIFLPTNCNIKFQLFPTNVVSNVLLETIQRENFKREKVRLLCTILR